MFHDPMVAAPDVCLAAFLAARDEDESRRELEILLVGLASPLILKVLRRQLGGAERAPAADLEDLHGELLLKLQLQLESARLGERPAPASFLDYVAVAAYNGAASFQMARQPERTRLRDRVRYVLRREERLATWTGADRTPVCGVAERRGEAADPAAAGRLAELAQAEVARSGTGWGSLPRQVRRVLERLDGACELEALVDAFAAATGVADGTVGLDAEAADRETGRLTPSEVSPPDVERRLDTGQRLAQVWSEILELPKNQRFAILSNLRDESGEAMLEELLATSLVDLPALAEALDLAPEALGDLLSRLPVDDAWIAAHLGLDRGQVSNLRKSGRLRLARRLRRALG